MQANIYYTSGWYTSGYAHEQEMGECADKIREATGWDVTLRVADRHVPDWPNVVRSYTVIAQIDDLDDLLRGIARLELEVIISHSPLYGTDIEIYDDYRE